MKIVTAVIRPNKLSALHDALLAMPDFPGMTVTKVEGCSAVSRHASVNLREQLTDYTPKSRIELVADDPIADRAYDLILNVAKTGQVGDGLVWIMPVDRASFVFKTVGQGEDQRYESGTER
jgi:nitrogen regulatory protein P-II 1